MIADPEHDRVAQLLGAYALDAVDADDGLLVDRHLAECPRCRAEVDDLRKVAADLALTGGIDSGQPPAGVWDRIVTGIGRSDSPPVAGTDGIESLSDRGRRVPPRSRAARRRAWLRGAVAGAAAAVIAALSIALVHSEGRVHQLQSNATGNGSHAAVHAALTSPGHRVVDLRAGDGTELAEVVVRADGVGFVVHSNLSTLPASRTYQLWASINGQPISLGLLGRRPASGAAFTLGGSTAAARELMVTVEPAGGVPAPDRAPIATAPLATA